VINAAIGNKSRFDAMSDFFGSTGTGHAAGVWESSHGVPQDRPDFKTEQLLSNISADLTAFLSAVEATIYTTITSAIR
jgi:hypothetical protein